MGLIPTATRIKASAIQAPSATGDNHATVLRQAKESIEVGQRLRGDVGDSYVRVSELVGLGLASTPNNVVNLIPPSTGGGGGSGTVTSVGLTDGSTTPIYSISGSPVTTSGTLTATLQTQAANKVFAGPTTGAAAQPTFRTLVAADLPSAALPGTINDLIFWFESDDIKSSRTGITIPCLRDRTPWLLNNAIPSASTDGPVTSATTINSLPTVRFNGNSARRMVFQGGGTLLDKSTTFVVLNPISVAAIQEIYTGASSCLEFRINTSGKLELVQSGIALIATSTGNVTVGTAVQFNMTYDASSGAFAFRMVRAASGSGTNAVSITSVTSTIGYHPTASLDLNSDVAALIIYNRVLSGTEITNVENYLNTKWNV